MPRLHHLLLPALALVFLSIYQTCLADLYVYEGMVRVSAGVDFWIVFASSMLVIFLFFPTRLERPSDMFLFFYLLISVLWGTVLWGGTGLIEAAETPLLFALQLLPVAAVVSVRAIFSRWAGAIIVPIQFASHSKLPLVLLLILATGALAAAATVGGGSFNWEEMYLRRLAGREAFAGQVFAAYAVGMASNGILPIFGFVAGYKRSTVMFAIALGFAVMMFFLLGLKSPVLNLVTLGGLGLGFSHSGLRRNLVPIALSAILAIYAVAFVAFIVNHDTFLADYLVRRISLVQPQVQSYYFDYWTDRATADALLARAPHSFSDTTFAIGYLYLHNPETNANTNAFIYALASGGLVSYLIAVFAVAVIFGIIDLMAEKTLRPEFFAVAALFSILLCEQAWTTVLMTSGIALCLALVMLFSYPSRKRIAAT